MVVGPVDEVDSTVHSAGHVVAEGEVGGDGGGQGATGAVSRAGLDSWVGVPPGPVRTDQHVDYGVAREMPTGDQHRSRTGLEQGPAGFHHSGLVAHVDTGQAGCLLGIGCHDRRERQQDLPEGVRRGVRLQPVA